MFLKKYSENRKLFCTLGCSCLFALLLFFLWPTPPDLISLFPLENYNQNIAAWIKPTGPAYEEPLLSANRQAQQLRTFNDHYFGKFSPWNPHYIQQIIHQTAPDDLKTIENALLARFSNLHKPVSAQGYGENFRAYSAEWLETLAKRIDFASLDHLTYQARHRAIAVDNLHARVLPTDEVFLYSFKLAGQGYPFDYLQLSAVWAGTPLYVLSETEDHAWSLVVTPDLIGWVKTNGLAYTNERFVNTWIAASNKKLAAIVTSQTPVIDQQGQFRFSAYIGSVFPAETSAAKLKIMLPAAGLKHQALIQYAQLAANQAALMPLQTSAHQFSNVIEALIGRPYGWGGMYFYNDCSAELKSLFTPFGIWLPRHSSEQVYAGKMVDLSRASQEQRLAYLLENGHHFLTIVYIGGHVFLYLGNYPDPNSKNTVALTYQNVWGFSPKPSSRRAVIGKAVLFPLLPQYPEDRSLISHAGKQYFQVSYLDQAPNNAIKLETLDLKSLMSLG